MKVNDNFYLKNFKGVRNIGYHYDEKKTEKGINGENLGFEKFVNLQFKLLFPNSALFKNFNISPFIHSNLALAPNRNEIPQD